MAGRVSMRYVSRRFSTSGKVRSEEVRAAENFYIKKMEKEKLEKATRQKMAKEKPEKAARQGLKAGTAASGSTVPPVTKTSGRDAASSKVSSDKNRNYAVIAGVVILNCVPPVTVACDFSFGLVIRCGNRLPEPKADYV